MSRMQRLIALAVIAAHAVRGGRRHRGGHAARTQGFFGVMWDRAAMDGRPVDQDAQWALMHRSGVESVRVVFNWAHAQPQAGVEPDFSEIDAQVEVAVRNRIDLLPVVLYGARTGRQMYPTRHGTPPRFPSDYAAFVRRLSALRPAGHLLGRAARLPRRPLRDWQIWNEPHFDFYWYTSGGSWAPEYVQLLKAARTAIKSVDPGARVVLAGFADASWKVLTAAYRAGARGAFDVATINLFTGKPGFAMTAARLTRHALNREHDRRKPIWVTETTFPAARGLVPPPEKDWQRRWYTTRSGHGQASQRALQAWSRERAPPRAPADLLVHVRLVGYHEREEIASSDSGLVKGAARRRPRLRSPRCARLRRVRLAISAGASASLAGRGRARGISGVPDRPHHDDALSRPLPHLPDVLLVDAADREPRHARRPEERRVARSRARRRDDPAWWASPRRGPR